MAREELEKEREWSAARERNRDTALKQARGEGARDAMRRLAAGLVRALNAVQGLGVKVMALPWPGGGTIGGVLTAAAANGEVPHVPPRVQGQGQGQAQGPAKGAGG